MNDNKIKESNLAYINHCENFNLSVAIFILDYINRINEKGYPTEQVWENLVRTNNVALEKIRGLR